VPRVRVTMTEIDEPGAPWAVAAREKAVSAWVKRRKSGRLFSEADREDWANATPEKGLRRALEYIEAVAQDTAAAPATGAEGREILFGTAGRLRAEFRAIVSVLWRCSKQKRPSGPAKPA
jgi:hypothetical protein